MSSSLLGIGISGLSAAQTGLSTTSHNISNVNTPSYSRQEVVQSSNLPSASGSGFIGQGVQVNTVRRIYSDSLQQQVQQTQANSSQLETYYAQITRIDNLLADPASGLSPVLNDFFTGVQGVATNPGDTPSRQVLLGTAQSLATRFSTINDQLEQLRSGVNQQVQQSVGQVNAYAQEIANLNQRIALVSGGNAAQVPNDLFDQRDQLLNDLNKQIGATVIKQSDGTANVFVGSGQALVLGTDAGTISAVADTQDPSNLQLTIQTGGASVRLPTSLLQGGTLTGLFDFRDNTLSSTENNLGRIAIALAGAFNDQHELGQDKNGQAGVAFFGAGVPQVIPNASNSSSGDVAVAINSPAQLTNSDYRLQYDGTNYTITRLTDSTAQSFTTLPQTLDGLTFSVASALTSGDNFLIEPTRTGARDFSVLISDPAKIAAAAPVRGSIGSSNTGTGAVSSLSVVPPPPANPSLQSPVRVSFHVLAGVTTYDLIDIGSGTPISTANSYTAGTAITQNGWSLTLSGAPGDGDTFSVGPNTNGVADSRNAVLLGSLQTQSLITGGATLQNAYGQVVSDVGNKAHELQVTSKVQDQLLKQAQQSKESVSGVNLDEEATNLLRFQQAYQASAKTLATAGLIFSTVLDLFR
ncbi:MAG: flagellar hook-associated protein FlgK [Pseudomonadota bacterium]